MVFLESFLRLLCSLEYIQLLRSSFDALEWIGGMLCMSKNSVIFVNAPYLELVVCFGDKLQSSVGMNFGVSMATKSDDNV